MLRSRWQRLTGLGVMLILLVVGVYFSLLLGFTKISHEQLMHAFVTYDPTIIEHLVVQSERLSRTLIALLVGSSLAVAGALMQTLTRNPLASPGILGINAGAMFFMVACSLWLSLSEPGQYVWAALAGGTAAALLVYLLGRDPVYGIVPLRIVLAGVAISALFVAFAQGMLILDQVQFEGILFWLAGSVSGRPLELVYPLLPLFLLAALVCVLLARQLNALALDDQLLKGLGQSVGWVKLATGAVVIVLAGSSVALAGMIGFVGLIVPHMVRALWGQDHRWLLPGCALGGGVLLVLADTLSRLLIAPQELPVGILTALLGTPFFLYLARRLGQG